MKFPRMIAVLGLTCALLLSSCGSEGTSSFSELMASKKNGAQQSPLTKMPEHMESMYGMEETSDSALTNETYPTLKEVMGDYSGCSLQYPNFEELSVGMLYKGEEHKYCLFDKDGKVHHMFDNDIDIVSGFYNGMCMTAERVMSMEDGTTFRPSYIPADEVLVSYFKNDSGTILWSVKQEDAIEGSKTILTAWDTTDGSVRFQCDTTQPEFVEVNSNPAALYEKMTGGFNNIIYEGGGTYLIKNAGYLGNVEVNIYAGSDEAPEKYNLAVSGGHGTIMYIAVRDGNLESFPEWENIASKRSCYPVLHEGLIFMSAWRNEVNGAEYPAGFYDIHLNRVIDLSEYDVRPISENSEPRFMNGYAVLQLRNPDGVLFWGVMDKNGNWTSQPQKGTIKYVFPTADGVLISTCEENTDLYQTYDQNGAKLQNWDGLQFNGYYGYADEGTTYGSYEVYDGFLYTDLSGHIAKISSSGTFEMLS